MYDKTLGIRNNNPGNIKKGAGFDGEITSTDPTFAQFVSMDMGVRAIGKLLLTYYYKYGIDTVDGLIRRYSATDQVDYVNNVSDFLHVGKYEHINVRNRLEELVTAIIRQENGPASYFVSAGDMELGIRNV